MSQYSLLGVESYKTTRKPARGHASSPSQIDLFRQPAKQATPPKAKKGQRYYVEKTGLIVTFIRQIGSSSLWECGGIVWKATAEEVRAGRLRQLQ